MNRESESTAAGRAAAYAAAGLSLERASTLPPDAYRDPELYRAEVERLFRSEWLCAGRVDQIPEPGDYRCLDLLGERLVLARDKSGTVRVLSRICRHRSAELIQGEGNANSFQCPYHAWTYRLDGSLAGAPLMDGAEAFDKTTCALPEIRSEVWEGWLFVNFDGKAEALGPRLAPLSERLAPYRMSSMIAREVAVYPSAFNWKVLVDNFMEAYHHIATHRTTFEPAFPARQSYVPDNEGPYSVLVMPRKDGNADDLSEIGHDLLACAVFPMHLFAPSEGTLAWYHLFPERWDHFTLRIYACVPREVLDDPAQIEGVEELKALIRHVHGEDVSACQAVWAGLCTSLAQPGRLSPFEKAIWQFNQWWLARMKGAVPR